MKYIWIALIYLGFFGLLGFCCWFFKSMIPLWGLLLFPSFSEKTEKEE